MNNPWDVQKNIKAYMIKLGDGTNTGRRCTSVADYIVQVSDLTSLQVEISSALVC